MRTLLAATTGATASSKVTVIAQGLRAPVTILVPGLASGEYGDLQIYNSETTTWHDVYAEGAQVRFTDTTNVYSVFGPGEYRVNKAASAAAVGVYVTDGLNV